MADKLHKTNIKDNRTTPVSCAGPHASKKSDRECQKDRTSLHFRFSSMPKWMSTRDRLRKGLPPLLSVAWHFLSWIEMAGE
jgi:hypothetical protein